MPKYVTESANVICIDGDYINLDEIAKISAAQEVNMEFLNGSEEGKKSKYWTFDIMFRGHSNVMHINGDSELEAELKRKFIIEAWTIQDIGDINSFDYDVEFVKFQEEMEGYEESEDGGEGDELN